MLIKIIAILLSWLAGLLAYSGSQHQLLFAKALPESVALIGTFATSTLAITGFLQLYPNVGAVFFWFLILMLSLVSNALLFPHVNNKIKVLAGTALVLCVIGMV